MNIVKLTQHGIAHYIVPVLVIAAVAAVGTVVIATHAQVPPEPYAAANCSIIFNPTTIYSGQSSQMRLTINNTGTANFRPYMAETIKKYVSSTSPAGYSSSTSYTTWSQTVYAKSSAQISLGNLKYSANWYKQTMTITGSNPSFTCTATLLQK